MRAFQLASLSGALWLLAACQDSARQDATIRSPGSGEASASACHVRIYGTSFRAGEDIPARMSLRNSGGWCFGGFGFSGVASGGSALISRPEHGDARILGQENGFLFGYRPRPGFTGTDGFIIAVPSGYGLSSNLSVTVVVS